MAIHHGMSPQGLPLMLFDLWRMSIGNYGPQQRPVWVWNRLQTINDKWLNDLNLKKKYNQVLLTLSHERLAAFFVVLSQSCLRTKTPSTPFASPWAPIMIVEIGYFNRLLNTLEKKKIEKWNRKSNNGKYTYK